MTQDDDRFRGLSGHARRCLREWRSGSAAELAAEVDALGVPMKREVVANLENGRRQEITLQELAAFALALGVSPVDLIAPADLDGEVEVIPGRAYRSWWVRSWWRGEGPLPDYATTEEMDRAEEAFLAHAPERVRRRARVGRHPLMGQLAVMSTAVEEALAREEVAKNDPAGFADYLRQHAERVVAYTNLLAEELEAEESRRG